MSRPEPDELVATTRSLKRKRLSSDDQDTLDELDGIFKRIRNAVPRVPYILSTPSMDPYRYHSQQEANAWMMGRLWRHNEEHTQYRTYLYREPCQDCFELQAGEEEEPEPLHSTSNTPNTNPVKKKMNLSAFKVKQANGTVVSGSKAASPSMAPTKYSGEQHNTAEKSGREPSSAKTATSKSPKHSTNSKDAHEEKRSERQKYDSAQRERSTSSTQKSDLDDPRNKVDRSNPSNSTPHGLPPMLSPVHDPLGNPYGFPTIVSPTLPTNIQAELDRLEIKRKRAESDASTSSSDRKSQVMPTNKSASLKPEDARGADTRQRSTSINDKSPKPAEDDGKEGKSRELIVTLKFSKARIPTFRNLIRLPPKRTHASQKERQDPPKETPIEVLAKPADEIVIKKKPIPKVAARRPAESATPQSGTPNKVTSTTTKVAEKRPRAADDEGALPVPAKRPRATSIQDRPITPVQQLASSPALSSKSSAQKGQTQFSTPKKEAKAISMLRTQSADSQNSTPGRSGNTPAGVKHEPKSGATSTPMNPRKQADINLLLETSQKLNGMGRTLKHEATKILAAKDNKLTKQDEKRAAVTNMECILSYMAAYQAQDLSLHLRGRPGDVEGTWKTLLPLCVSYTHSTRGFRHLDGLRLYLGSVIASAICTSVSQRGSTQRASEMEASKYQAFLAENFTLLSEHTIQMTRQYQHARIALPMDEVQSVYKKTYAGREVDPKMVKEADKNSGARLSGPYFLPLSMDTSPIQAVRFGLRFLSEFCEREKLNYHIRVNLDKPS